MEKTKEQLGWGHRPKQLWFLCIKRRAILLFLKLQAKKQKSYSQRRHAYFVETVVHTKISAHFKIEITTPEGFIRLVAAKGLLSRKSYLLRGLDGKETWLDV